MTRPPAPRIRSLRLRRLEAQLPAPMRSRGDIGYREFFHTGSERQRLDVVELAAEDGLTGFTLLPGGAAELPEFLARVAEPALLGGDAGCVSLLRERLLRGAAEAGERFGRMAGGAINRLEFALWDLAAKQAGQPLWRFLGGDAGGPVRVYAGGGSLCWNPLDDLLEETRQLLERGFRALKIKIGHGPEEDAAIIRAIGRLAGPETQIMVDSNRAYDLEGALRLAAALEEADVYWFEEPFTYDKPDEWRSLAEATRARIAGGEGFSRIMQAAEALRGRMLSVLQCDAGGFGLEALRTIASVAAEEGASLTPHSCNSVIGFVVACHLQRAIPNPEIQEFETFDNPFIHSIFNEPFTLLDGALFLPDAPGLGYTLSEATIERWRVV